MPTLLITGTNRGLGLEFVRQYAAEGWRIHACARRPEAAPELLALAEAHPEVSLHAVDVGELSRLDELSEELAGVELQLLVSNAGVFGRETSSLGSLDLDAWADTLRINLIAPVRLGELFADRLAAGGGKLVGVTSKMGSIADNGSGGSYSYRSSKAGLNAAFKSLALDLAPRGVPVCVVHPGWVRTDMGGSSAPLVAEESVAGMRRVIDALDAERSGRFWNWDGEELPW